jgi:hypothetical protein
MNQLANFCGVTWQSQAMLATVIALCGLAGVCLLIVTVGGAEQLQLKRLRCRFSLKLKGENLSSLVDGFFIRFGANCSMRQRNV